MLLMLHLVMCTFFLKVIFLSSLDFFDFFKDFFEKNQRNKIIVFQAVLEFEVNTFWQTPQPKNTDWESRKKILHYGINWVQCNGCTGVDICPLEVGKRQNQVIFAHQIWGVWWANRSFFAHQPRGVWWANFFDLPTSGGQIWEISEKSDAKITDFSLENHIFSFKIVACGG